MKSGSDPNKAAMKPQKAQMKRLDAISLPELEEYILQNPELVGLLDAEELGASAMEEISLDPALRDKQMQALASLQERSDEGLTATDKYAMEQMLGEVAGQEQARQKQIESQMAQQGMDSSGAALQAKLAGKQSSSNAAREQAMQMAAQGQQNRMQALQALGQQAGQMETADYGRQAQLANARDTISRYNAQNRQGVNQMNLAARQNIANQRTNIANQQAQLGNQLAQQNFTNQIAKATGQGNVANSMSNIAANTPAKPSAFQSALGGAATGASIGSAVPGIGTGVGAGIGAAAGLFGAEDGGIARNYENGGMVQANPNLDAEYKEKERKQREAFKSKYLKSIQDELLPKKEPIKAEDGAIFKKNDDYVNKQADQYAMGKDLDAAQMEAQSGQLPKSGMSLDGDKLAKDLGALNQLLGAKEQKKPALNLGSFSMDAPENLMTPISPMDFGNVYAAADGAMISKLVDPSEFPERGGTDFASPDDRQSAIAAALLAEMKGMNPQEIPMLPEYGCGGVHKKKKYENGGTPMYASDGMGDIIDSGMDSYAGDRVDAKVNDGEIILNIPQQQRLMDLLRGKISLTELGDDDIVEGVPKDYRDDLHEELEMESEEPDMETLIKLLGK